MEYNAEEIKERFLIEYARIKHKGVVNSDAEFCQAIGRKRNFISHLVNPGGTKYLINAKDLFYASYVFGFDIDYIFYGVRVRDVGYIPPLEELKKNGHWKKK